MIWLLISVVLLIVLIFFRIDILLVAPIVSVFLCLVSGLDVVDTLEERLLHCEGQTVGYQPEWRCCNRRYCNLHAA